PQSANSGLTHHHRQVDRFATADLHTDRRLSRVLATITGLEGEAIDAARARVGCVGKSASGRVGHNRYPLAALGNNTIGHYITVGIGSTENATSWYPNLDT